jgi:hypothetical protein
MNGMVYCGKSGLKPEKPLARYDIKRKNIPAIKPPQIRGFAFFILP